MAYGMLWQEPICALIAGLSAVAAAAMLWRMGRRPPRAVDLWAPCWRSLSPFWLLGYRGLVFLVMSSLLILRVLRVGAHAFYFYTEWTFALVIIYFVIGILISAHGFWIYSRTNSTDSEEAIDFLKGDCSESNALTLTSRVDKVTNDIRLTSHFQSQLCEQRAGFCGYAMQIVYQTCAGAVMLTDLVFWGLLFPFFSNEYSRLDLIVVCMHSLNAMFLLIDTVLSRLPFPWFGMSYFVLWSCTYVIFLWILQACGLAWWPYPFMELSTPWAPLWYLAIALVHIPCFGIYYVIGKAKDSFFSKSFPNSYIKSSLE